MENKTRQEHELGDLSSSGEAGDAGGPSAPENRRVDKHLAAIERLVRSIHYYGDPPDSRLQGRVDADVEDVLDRIRERDEERLQRLTEIGVRKIDATGHNVVMDLTLSKEVMAMLAGAAMAMLDETGAENYVEMGLRDPKSLKETLLTIQRYERPTPHDLRVRAEEAAKDYAAKLQYVMEHSVESEDGIYMFPDGDAYDCKKAAK